MHNGDKYIFPIIIRTNRKETYCCLLVISLSVDTAFVHFSTALETDKLVLFIVIIWSNCFRTNRRS